MEAIEAQNSMDIKENYIMCLDKRLLGVLLKDKSSGENIIWATDMYAWRGSEFHPREPITVQAITGRRGNVIKPRIEKSKKEQKERIRKKAEVFTPSWICNLMASGFDSWFDKENVFNIPYGLTWKKCKNKITFSEGKSWKDYVRLRVLEITCGEAPFLASRNDTVTGEWIDVNSRVGLIDRKLRVVNENTDSETDWIKYAFEAYQSTYGFEWQGDSLLIARENLLFTFIDYYNDRFGKLPEQDILLQLATILSWNIFQMDGLRYVVPHSCEPKTEGQMNMFDELSRVGCCGCVGGDNGKHIGIYSKIKNWRSKTVLDFYSLTGGKSMKFDFIIGNPPYQASNDREDATRGALPIYHLFLNESYKISDKVMMIHPARFLFNAGSTPKEWNRKMLDDPHLKVLHYEVDSSKAFPTTDIKGGIAITYHDATNNFGAIETFSAFNELNAILKKVKNRNFKSFNKIVYSRTSYRLTDKMHEDHPEALSQLSNGHPYDMSSNIFVRLPQIFFDEKPNDDNDYIEIYGLIGNNRCFKHVRRDYVNNFKNLDTYKVFVPQANGSGAIGEVLSTPVIGQPVIGHTETFLSVGCFETEEEAKAVLKYIKTKFARTLLGVLKVTQNNPPAVWEYVPMQDFTSSSDIDWTQPINFGGGQLFVFCIFCASFYRRTVISQIRAFGRRN